MATGTLPIEIERALKEVEIPRNNRDLTGFSIIVSNETYRFLNGIIISRQGVNAFMLNTSGSGVPTANVEHIMGSDTFTVTISGQTANFTASTTWNDFKLLFSTTLSDGGYTMQPILTT